MDSLAGPKAGWRLPAEPRGHRPARARARRNRRGARLRLSLDPGHRQPRGRDARGHGLPAGLRHRRRRDRRRRGELRPRARRAPRRLCTPSTRDGAHFSVINEYFDGSSDIGVDPPPSDALAGTISSATYAWLEADLEAASARSPAYIFVVGHEPAYPLPDAANGRLRHRGDSLDAHPAEVESFMALLRSYSVTAYICGHTHDLQRRPGGRRAPDRRGPCPRPWATRAR